MDARLRRLLRQGGRLERRRMPPWGLPGQPGPPAPAAMTADKKGGPRMNSKMSRPLSPAGLKTYSLKSRKSKVDIRSFGRCAPSSPAFRGLVNSLPDILAGRDFKELVGPGAAG